MKESPSIGMNKTGIQMAPRLIEEMKNHEEAMIRGFADDKVGKSYVDIRAEAYREYGQLGSVPAPLTAKGLAKTGLQKITGNNPEVLMDKIGERIAYERSGVRLYETLIAKCEALDHAEDATQFGLREIMEEEAKHLSWVIESMEKLGGDPTAMTPCADATAVASQGIFKVVVDPRTSLSQSAQAILMAELTDTEGWGMLVKLARQMGLEDEAEKFEVAHREEEVHIEKIRAWFEHLTLKEAEITFQ